MERSRVRRQKDKDLERALLEEWWKYSFKKRAPFVPPAAPGLTTRPSEAIKRRPVGGKQLLLDYNTFSQKERWRCLEDVSWMARPARGDSDDVMSDTD